MKKSISKLYYTIPILYGILILFLLYLHFEKGNTFEKRLRKYTISGEYYRGKNKKLKKIELNFGSFTIPFSKNHPIKVKQQKREEILFPTRYTITENRNIEIWFSNENENELKITISDKNNVLTITPDTGTTGRYLLIPLQKHEREIKQQSKEIPILIFSKNQSTEDQYLTLNTGSYIKNDMIYLHLKSETSIHIFTKKRDTTSKNLNLVYIQDRTIISDVSLEKLRENLKREIATYLNRSFEGWNNIRFKNTIYKWKKGKEYLFNEEIEAAAIAEALYREKTNIIPQYLRALRLEMKRNPNSQIPYLTSTYFGGLKRFVKRKNRETKQLIKSITEGIKTHNISIFENPTLVVHLLDSAPYSLLEETTKYADSLDIEKLSLTTAIYLLHYYNQLIHLVEDKNLYTERIDKIVEDKIIPNIVVYQRDSIYIKELESQPYLSILAGIDIATTKNLSIEKNKIGTLLVLSELKTADSRGVIKNSLYPEDIYSALCRIVPRYYPQEKPFYKIHKPGTWLWTASIVKDVSYRNNHLSIEIEYSEKQPHFILIQGIKTPQIVTLHSLQWRPDKFYYNYRDGWFYNEETQSLFIKLTNRKASEKITVLF